MTQPVKHPHFDEIDKILSSTLSFFIPNTGYLEKESDGRNFIAVYIGVNYIEQLSFLSLAAVSSCDNCGWANVGIPCGNFSALILMPLVFGRK